MGMVRLVGVRLCRVDCGKGWIGEDEMLFQLQKRNSNLLGIFQIEQLST